MNIKNKIDFLSKPFDSCLPVRAAKYGDTADECGEALFLCGKSLLELARLVDRFHNFRLLESMMYWTGLTHLFMTNLFTSTCFQIWPPFLVVLMLHYSVLLAFG